MAREMGQSLVHGLGMLVGLLMGLVLAGVLAGVATGQRVLSRRR
ncbi:MAG: hypothetical protein ACOYXW_06950 [Actinomycetota bacterium]